MAPPTASANEQGKPAGLPCANSSASFWHSEPNKFLINHCTTEELPKSADVVIVGSGITGASVARFLSEDSRASNLNVVLLDAREICWGATGRNGGHCQPLLLSRDSEVAAFEVKNVKTVREYIQRHSVQCEWRDVPACMTFWSKPFWEAARSAVNDLKQTDPDLGAMVETIHDKESLKKHRVEPDAVGATITQGAASLWPYKLVTFIVEKLVKEGRLNVQTNTPVTRIEPCNGSDAEDGSTQILHTPKGSIRAKNVVLATNGYTSAILNSFASLIVPVRCEMSALHPPKGSTMLPNSYGFAGIPGYHPNWDDYLVQRPFYESPNGDGSIRGGHLMFGGGRGHAEYNCIGETDDDIVDPGEAAYLRRRLLEVLSLGGDDLGHSELKASHQWTGIKGFSRDDRPWVGRLQKGLWISAGYTGHGMPNATLCAKAVVQMVLGENEGKDYGSICQSLVDGKDLPSSYVLSEARISEAMARPTVAVQDGEGFLTPRDLGGTADAKKSSSGSCSVM